VRSAANRRWAVAVAANRTDHTPGPYDVISASLDRTTRQCSPYRVPCHAWNRPIALYALYALITLFSTTVYPIQSNGFWRAQELLYARGTPLCPCTPDSVHQFPALQWLPKDLGFHSIKLGLELKFEACDLNLSYHRLGYGTWDSIWDLPITKYKLTQYNFPPNH